MKKYSFIVHILCIILIFIIGIITIPHTIINKEFVLTINALAKRLIFLIFLIPSFYIVMHYIKLIKSTLNKALI